MESTRWVLPDPFVPTTLTHPLVLLSVERRKFFALLLSHTVVSAGHGGMIHLTMVVGVMGGHKEEYNLTGDLTGDLTGRGGD